MQQKRGSSRLGVFLTLAAVLLACGVAALLLADIPAPQKPIEVQLDAKAFLEQK